jgi:putative FmdB family regulatory protein
MPIYAYRCQSCQGVHEALQKFSDAPLVDCPHCGQSSLRRLISPAGIIFKGSGFHKNDYGPNGKSASKSSSKAEKTGTESASEGKKTDGESKVA